MRSKEARARAELEHYNNAPLWLKFLIRLRDFPYKTPVKSDPDFWLKTWVMIALAAFFCGALVSAAVISCMVNGIVQDVLNEVDEKFKADGMTEYSEALHEILDYHNMTINKTEISNKKRLGYKVEIS